MIPITLYKNADFPQSIYDPPKSIRTLLVILGVIATIGSLLVFISLHVSLSYISLLGRRIDYLGCADIALLGLVFFSFGFFKAKVGNPNLGSQIESNGPVDREKAREYIHKLNERAPESITFSEDSIVSDLIGGTCTAMTLDFLSKIKNSENPVIFYEENSKRYLTSSEEFRSLQAAFNCINVDSNIITFDQAEIEKALSLTRFYELEAIPVTEPIDLGPIDLGGLGRRISNLRSGRYFIRAVQRANNHKKEHFGHSMALIKEPHRWVFYNPNEGLKIFDRRERLRAVVQIFDSLNMWDLRTLRFFLIS